MGLVENAADREFDLEEFRSLREEILQKVDAISKLQRLAAGGAAAIYAWLATQEGEHARWIWLIPVLLVSVGWIWALKIGHQAFWAGQYISILEKRLRVTPLKEELVSQSVPVPSLWYRVRTSWRPLLGKRLPADSFNEIHGWEWYIRIPSVRDRFLDRVSHFFWFLVLLLTIWLAMFPPIRSQAEVRSASESNAADYS